MKEIVKEVIDFLTKRWSVILNIILVFLLLLYVNSYNIVNEQRLGDFSKIWQLEESNKRILEDANILASMVTFGFQDKEVYDRLIYLENQNEELEAKLLELRMKGYQ